MLHQRNGILKTIPPTNSSDKKRAEWIEGSAPILEIEKRNFVSNFDKRRSCRLRTSGKR